MNYLRLLAGEDKDIILSICDTTAVLKEAKLLHQLSPAVSVSFGKGISAVYLMNSFNKDERASTSLTISSFGPLKKMTFFSGGNTLKGSVSENNIPLEGECKTWSKQLFQSGGTLSVLKELPGGRPFSGQLELISDELAQNIAYYYAHSEQQPSVVVLDVKLDKNLDILASGGMIIQLLPNASERAIRQLEKQLSHMQESIALIAKGMTLEAVASYALGGIPYKKMTSNTFKYNCDCSREKVERALISAGIETLQDICNKEKSAEVNCHFCNTHYVFSERELKEIIARLKSGESV